MSKIVLATIVVVGLSGCTTELDKPAAPGAGGGAGGKPGAGATGITANQRVEQLNQLKQLGLAIHNYHSQFNQTPNNLSGADGAPLLSWRVDLLRILDPALHAKFKLDEAWDGPTNKPLLEYIPSLYGPPGGQTQILMFSGPQTVLRGKKATFGSITDGLSNSIAMMIAPAAKAVPWTKPDDIPLDPDPLANLGTIPESGLPVLMFDGSVTVFRSNIPADKLKSLASVNDGAVVDKSEWMAPR